MDLQIFGYEITLEIRKVEHIFPPRGRKRREFARDVEMTRAEGKSVKMHRIKRASEIARKNGHRGLLLSESKAWVESAFADDGKGEII